jgi:hypothetical protein
MNATFRLRRSYLALRVLGTLFFATMAVVSVLGIYFEAPADRRAAGLAVGLGFAAFWLLLAAFGVWVLLAYWRERLAVHDAEIDHVGVIRRKRMRVPDMVSARWRCWPAGGSLVLKSNSTRLVIYFDNFAHDERRQLIRFFRESVPISLQTGWELFFVRVGRPQAHRTRQLEKTAPGEGEVLLTRRRLDTHFLAGTLLVAATGVFVYHVTGDAGVFAKLAVIPAIWLLVRFLTPRKGGVRKRLTADPRGRFVLFTYLWLFGGMAVLLSLKAFFPNAVLAFMIPFFVISFAGIFTGAWRLNRRRWHREREAIEELRRRGQLVPEELSEV